MTLPTRLPPSGWKLVRLVWQVQRLQWRVRPQYRVDFLLWTLHGLAYRAMGLTFLWVVVARFRAMAGWTLPEILFLYSLRLLVHGLYLQLLSSVASVSALVRQGTFDRILLRPVSPLLQVVMDGSSQGKSFGDLFLAAALFGFAQGQVHLRWSLPAMMYLALAILGGVVLEASIQLALSTLAFWMVETQLLNNWADLVMNLFPNYPLTIYGRIVQIWFTAVMPVAFLSYVPASVLLGKAGEATVGPVLAYGAPAVGWAVATLAYLAWTRGVRHYQSTGT